MIRPGRIVALITTGAACVALLLGACGDSEEEDSAATEVATTSPSEETTAGGALDGVTACLEDAGFTGFFVNEDSTFPGVEFQIDGPLQGEGAFLVYGYESAETAKAEQDAISIDIKEFPDREVVGRSVVVYGADLTDEQRSGLVACVEPI